MGQRGGDGVVQEADVQALHGTGAENEWQTRGYHVLQHVTHKHLIGYMGRQVRTDNMAAARGNVGKGGT